MADSMDSSLLKELHLDLSRKYKIHSERIEQIWHSLSQAQRAKAMKASTSDGIVLKHPWDTSLGRVGSRLIPDWNLRDVSAPESDYFLHLLKYRATTPLEKQYTHGFGSRRGDHEHILEIISTQNLGHINPLKDCYMMFTGDNEQYGYSFKISKDHEPSFEDLAPAFLSGRCVPQFTGQLIVARQLVLFEFLNLMIETVLDVGSTTRVQEERCKKNRPESVTRAFSSLSIAEGNPKKIKVSDLIAYSLNRKSFLEEYLSFLCTEPAALAHDISIWNFSRPELVADEKGRRLPLYTDKYISYAFFEVVHGAVMCAATWNYLHRLLGLYENSTAKAHQVTLLQEISNVCHSEYVRAQTMLKRHLAMGIGRKCFRRMSSPPENRLVMKCNPGLLTREDPLLHYLLRLCHPETTASKALGWVQKLDDLVKSHPLEREAMQEQEADSLCDMALIVGFTQALSKSTHMPSFSRNKGRLFVSRAAQLESELSQIKGQIDLTDYAAPIDNLREPGMAEKALEMLDRCIFEKMGKRVGLLYEDLIKDCASRMGEQQIKDQADQQAKFKFVPLPSGVPAQPQDVQTQEKRQKEKTRPSHPSIYRIVPSVTDADQKEVSKIAQPIQPLIVKPRTAETFSILFTKSEARGSIPWSGFEAAMADLGFSVIPEYGSVYTFTPPSELALNKSIKVHRPHKSHIEGHKLLFIAGTLKRNYGWTIDTFQDA
ncbi:hypothetical protein F4804DRAFT_350368 [Jackrogersella minutella]|nr:hypothetical protein F4804DRAFT_350368 [Jackrogersella minutella]